MGGRGWEDEFVSGLWRMGDELVSQMHWVNKLRGLINKSRRVN